MTIANEVPENAHAADFYDEHGAYLGTARLDTDDLNRCSHQCNCTPGEQIDAGVKQLVDESDGQP